MNYTAIGLKKLSSWLLFLPRAIGKFLLWLVFAEISVLIQFLRTPKMFLDWLGGDPNLRGESFDYESMSWRSKFDQEWRKRVGKRFSFIKYSDNHYDEGSYRNGSSVIFVPIIVLIIMAIV